MKRRNLLTIGLCLVSAGASFLATVAAAPKWASGGSDASRLHISAKDWEAARQFDPTFESESAAMNQALSQARARLADMLDDDDSSDEAIMAQVENVITAHDQLERRVAQHLLKIRHQLTPAQQKQLMGLVSDAVRHGRYRWRGGRGADGPSTNEPGEPAGRRGKGKAD